MSLLTATSIIGPWFLSAARSDGNEQTTVDAFRIAALPLNPWMEPYFLQMHTTCDPNPIFVPVILTYYMDSKLNTIYGSVWKICGTGSRVIYHELTEVNRYISYPKDYSTLNLSISTSDYSTSAKLPAKHSIYTIFPTFQTAVTTVS